MKKIPLTQGAYALVDDEDYDYINQWKWSLHHGYATRNLRYVEHGEKIKKTLPMHRLIAKTPEGLFTDHVNGNRLDNRRSNLRLCTQSENNCNVGLYKNNKSGFIGVRWKSQSNKWVARITKTGKQIHLGYFDNVTDAARAYDAQAVKLHGKFARLNFKEIK